MRLLLGGGIYFTFLFPNAAFLKSGVYKRAAFKRKNMVMGSGHVLNAYLFYFCSLPSWLYNLFADPISMDLKGTLEKEVRAVYL